ncbi:MAG TPA: Uric acid permease PucJ, partial [Lactobacillus acetotolerans]|nr:Uric acid permease PucJ [Lactobacillus acetotolerans]
GNNDSKNLIVSFITIAIIIALEIWAKGFLKSISVLIGLILGTIIASFMGLVSLKPVIQASWFH